eukprot:TRINITY_DN32761_c0_g1_i1.p1 TRINITY_DN32761_c0_g1~~TRINITY_DN32761_c0_g1_i1.p1  ORF type:complete len:775 (+),score=229.57 TRINITY_DN32761_c0_g1_i1:223-2325(+)
MLESTDQIQQAEALKRQQLVVAFQRGLGKAMEHESRKQAKAQELAEAEREQQQCAEILQDVGMQRLRELRLQMDHRKRILTAKHDEQETKAKLAKAADDAYAAHSSAAEELRLEEERAKVCKRQSIANHQRTHVVNLRRLQRRRRKEAAAEEKRLQRALADAEHHRQLEGLTHNLRSEESERKLQTTMSSSTAFRSKHDKQVSRQQMEKKRRHVIAAFLKERHEMLRWMLEQYAQWEVEAKNHVSMLYKNAAQKLFPRRDVYDTTPLRPPADWRDANKSLRQRKHEQHVQEKKEEYMAAKAAFVQGAHEEQLRLRQQREENNAARDAKRLAIKESIVRTRLRLEARKATRSPARRGPSHTPLSERLRASPADASEPLTSPHRRPGSACESHFEIDDGSDDQDDDGSTVPSPSLSRSRSPPRQGQSDGGSIRRDCETSSNVDSVARPRDLDPQALDDPPQPASATPRSTAKGGKPVTPAVENGESPRAKATPDITPSAHIQLYNHTHGRRKAKVLEDRQRRLAERAERDAAEFAAHAAEQRALQRGELDEARKRRENIESHRRRHVANLQKHRADQERARLADSQRLALGTAPLIRPTGDAQAPAPSSLLWGEPHSSTPEPHHESPPLEAGSTKKRLPRPWWAVPTVRSSPFALAPHDPYLAVSASQAGAALMDTAVRLFADVDHDLQALDRKSRKLALAL